MNVFREIFLVTLRELSRGVRSAKGIALATLCVIGGLLTGAAGVYAEKVRRGVEEGMLADAKVKGLTLAYGGSKEVGRFLAQAPDVALTALGAVIALVPIGAAFVGYDVLAGEVQHRTVRYWTTRVRRISIVLGKTLGLFLTVSVMSLLSVVVAAVYAIFKSNVDFADLFGWSIRLWAWTLPLTLTWSAITTAVSSLFRLPGLALLTSLLVWVFVAGVSFFGRIADRDAFVFIHPNALDRYLLSPDLVTALSAIVACGAWSAAFLAIGTVVFGKRDV